MTKHKTVTTTTTNNYKTYKNKDYYTKKDAFPFLCFCYKRKNK